MFACAKLARTPALVRNPALGPANTLRDRLSFTLATMSSPPSLPPSQPWGPADCSPPCVSRGLSVRPTPRRSQPPCSLGAPLPHLPVPAELGSARRSGCWEVRGGRCC